MPCSDGGQSNEFVQGRLNLLTRCLCYLCEKVEKKHANWIEEHPDLRIWWANHKAVKQEALAKLTKEERLALGFNEEANKSMSDKSEFILVKVSRFDAERYRKFHVDTELTKNMDLADFMAAFVQDRLDEEIAFQEREGEQE